MWPLSSPFTIKKLNCLIVLLMKDQSLCLFIYYSQLISLLLKGTQVEEKDVPELLGWVFLVLKYSTRKHS